jgi:hypothetical protein
MGMELCSVDSNSSGLYPVDSKSLLLVIAPKSMDRFVERLCDILPLSKDGQS